MPAKTAKTARKKKEATKRLPCAHPGCKGTHREGSKYPYCSDCQQKNYHRTSQREAARAAVEKRICADPECKQEFVPANPRQKFHSPKCRYRVGNLKVTASRKKTLPPIKCALPECKKQFVPRRKNETCCSPEHWKELRRRKLRKQHGTAHCALKSCGKEFEKKREDQRYCSQVHNREALNEAARDRRSRGGAKSRPNARTHISSPPAAREDSPSRQPGSFEKAAARFLDSADRAIVGRLLDAHWAQASLERKLHMVDYDLSAQNLIAKVMGQ